MPSARSGIELIIRRNSGCGMCEHAAGPGDARREVRPLAGQQAQLAEEAARSVHGDDDVAVGSRAHDVDLALEDDEEVIRRVAGPEQLVADCDVALGAERRELGQRRTPQDHHRVAVVRRDRVRVTGSGVIGSVTGLVTAATLAADT